jgi:DHA2 family multidrug resistance protein-like MFS transporter
MGAGLVAAAIGFAVLSRIAETGLAGLVTGSLIFSLGLAPAITLGTDLIVGSAPRERAGAAAAISETSSEFGGALGIAILGSIATAIYRADMARAVLDGVPAEARRTARDTLGGAAAAAAALPDQVGARLLDAARVAFTHALQVTVAICAVVSALAAIVAVVALRRIRAGEQHG